MDAFWAALSHRLGINHLITHARRQEALMGKLSDELDDLNRRNTAIADAVSGLTDSINTEVGKLNDQIEALRDGDLTAENQARVDAMKQSADNILAAVQAADDGYNPPNIEPSPFPPAGDDQPAPGSVDGNQTSAV